MKEHPEGPSTHLLLTGRPGIGKTTVIKGVLERIQGMKVLGFFTEEIREKGKRVGFRITLIPEGEEGVLAHRESKSPYRIGKYGVEVGTFERMVIPPLLKAPKARIPLLVLDEIGGMELLSSRFTKEVRELFKRDSPHILGTLQLKRRSLIDEWDLKDRVLLLELREGNHSLILERILNWLKSLKEKGEI